MKSVEYSINGIILMIILVVLLGAAIAAFVFGMAGNIGGIT